MRFIDLDTITPIMRKRVADLEGRKFLISRFAHTKQEKDASCINCRGFGRIRTLRTSPQAGWGKSCARHRIAYHRLHVAPSETATAQIFQIAGCNFRCWFCFVDYVLLSGNIHHAEWFSAADLVDMYMQSQNRTNVLVLSGGQPDLAPEWTAWTLAELDRRGIGSKVFLWSDDNLSGFLSWEVLKPEDWEMMRRPTFAKLCALKGIDERRFSENTSVNPRYFKRQFEILRRLIKERISIFIELVLTSADDSDISQSIRCFVDELCNVHPYLPLRVNPTEIREYSPTAARLNPERTKALKNQYKFNEAWSEELDRRYSPAELATHQAEIPLW